MWAVQAVSVLGCLLGALQSVGVLRAACKSEYLSVCHGLHMNMAVLRRAGAECMVRRMGTFWAHA